MLDAPGGGQSVDDAKPATAGVGWLGRAHRGLPDVVVGGFDADLLPGLDDRQVERAVGVPDAVGGQLGDEELDGGRDLRRDVSQRVGRKPSRRGHGRRLLGKTPRLPHGDTPRVCASPMESITRRSNGCGSRISRPGTIAAHLTHSAIAELSANRSELTSITRLSGSRSRIGWTACSRSSIVVMSSSPATLTVAEAASDERSSKVIGAPLVFSSAI